MIDPDGELVGFGSEQMAGDADDIAEIEQLEKLERVSAHYVEPDIDLQPRAATLYVRKSGLAMRTQGEDPACDANLDVLGFENCGVPGAVPGDDLRQGYGLLEPVGVRVAAQCVNFSEF